MSTSHLRLYHKDQKAVVDALVEPEQGLTLSMFT